MTTATTVYLLTWLHRLSWERGHSDIFTYGGGFWRLLRGLLRRPGAGTYSTRIAWGRPQSFGLVHEALR